MRAIRVLGALLLLVTGVGVAGAGEAGAASPPVISDVLYTTGNCPGVGPATPEYLDVYPANSQAFSPVVVMVHGGNFVGGRKTDPGIVSKAEDLAAHGWTAVSVDYCLPPTGTAGYPVEIQNVEAAVAFMVAHASTYHLDPSHVALWGFSAGASLALVSAARLGTQSSTAPVAVAAGWSGPYDFLDDRGASQQNLDVAHNYLGCTDLTQPSCHKRAAGASAATQVSATTPPTYVANSTQELIPIYQLRDEVAALTAGGIPVQKQVIPGSRHALGYSKIAYCPTVAFLSTYLGPYYGTCSPT